MNGDASLVASGDGKAAPFDADAPSRPEDLLDHYRRALALSESRIAELEGSLALRIGQVVIKATRKWYLIPLVPFFMLRERRRWRRDRQRRLQTRR